MIPAKRSQQILETILDGMDDAVLVVDDELTIVLANQRLKTLFEVANGLVGRDLMEIVLDHRIREVVQCAFAQWAGQKREIILARTRHGSSQERLLVVDAEPLPNQPSDHPLVRVILRDDSSRHQIEQIRRDFVANASHELRTPLSIINGYIENLLDGAVEQPALAMKFLGVMKKHGERIARIVEDMLTLSKFESASEDSIRSSVFDLQSCIADVVERLQPLIEEKKARVEVVASRSPISGDRFYWDQIFFNLIDNALKQNQRPGLRVTVTCEPVGDHYVIEVVDNGVGIPRADLPFIFKRFYRVEKHHSQEIKGTGLGLSIVKRAVEAHKGTVSASSVPGERTAFTIRVPKGPPTALTPDAEAGALEMAQVG